MIGMSRSVGELETQMLALGVAPRGDRSLSKNSEPHRTVRSRCEIRQVFHREGLRYNARRYTLQQ